ncbi:polyketide synthase dehydratase domain-containing protein, partial [Mycolicibacterium gadium]|uniref:polyketide synthase dehydratase domain-containing protein n=1 Tax=Mycolicibacterium gadium TaxID=1794 RepID=UPI0021F36176
LPGAAYCEMALAAAREMALAAARTIFGDDAEVRDVTFDAMLLLKDLTPVPGVLQFMVETDIDGEREQRASGEREQRASAVLTAREAGEQPQPYDMDALQTAHPTRADGDGVRQWFDGRGVQFGPAFTALQAVNAADENADTVLAEIGLPTSIRNQQTSYGVHPALLDACFQSVAAHPGVQASGTGALLLPLGVDRLRVHGPVRNARYCLTRVTSLDGSTVQADIDLLDDYGTVLFTVEGLRMGSGMSESNEGDRVLNERLLGIEWRQHQLAEVTQNNSATWLLVSTSDTVDLLASALTDALKLN